MALQVVSRWRFARPKRLTPAQQLGPLTAAHVTHVRSHSTTRRALRCVLRWRRRRRATGDGERRRTDGESEGEREGSGGRTTCYGGGQRRRGDDWQDREGTKDEMAVLEDGRSAA